MIQRIAGFGFEPISNSQQEFGEFVKSEVAQWAKFPQESGAKVDRPRWLSVFVTL